MRLQWRSFCERRCAAADAASTEHRRSGAPGAAVHPVARNYGTADGLAAAVCDPSAGPPGPAAAAKPYCR